MAFLRPLFVSFASLTLLTGLAYPAAITGLARLCFPRQAEGSLLRVDGKVRGSRLIAQATEDPRYFWSRPSSTAPFPTNAGASAGSCVAASNPGFAELVAKRMQLLRASDPGNPLPLPQDLITASGSGLDPHISPEGARWQIARIARLRHLETAQVQSLVDHHTEGGVVGPPRVNVLALNLQLDQIPGR